MSKEKIIQESVEGTPAEIPVKIAYHFPGEMKWQPLSVEAESLEEAQVIWEKKRQLIN